MTTRYWLVVVLIVAVTGCSGGPPSPAGLDTRQDRCAQCRMAVLDVRVAAQIVASGQDPLFFDDIGCMIDYLSRHLRQPPGAMAYVADHQTGEWVPAATALYTRNLQVQTPMGSHLIAHGSIETQRQDPAARLGSKATARDLLPLDMPDGTR